MPENRPFFFSAFSAPGIVIDLCPGDHSRIFRYALRLFCDDLLRGIFGHGLFRYDLFGNSFLRGSVLLLNRSLRLYLRFHSFFPCGIIRRGLFLLRLRHVLRESAVSFRALLHGLRFPGKNFRHDFFCHDRQNKRYAHQNTDDDRK
ncbi:MAG: hypothetical protein K5985_09085 [Lachnospiraceae bacterium]|nr:hypothetical protein [Lachnospiraceae bacterium]